MRYDDWLGACLIVAATAVWLRFGIVAGLAAFFVAAMVASYFKQAA